MEFLKSLSLWKKRTIAGLLGAIAGFAYYHYIGCASGTCAITSNPYISTLYGAALALLLVPSPQSKKENTNGNTNTSTD